MKSTFPISYNLESGTHVEVDRATTGNAYNFFLRTSDGAEDNFTYVDDGRSRDDIEAELDFDQLNALRAFWLKMEEMD